MLSKQQEQAERLDVLRNEQRLRNQGGSTFSAFAQADADIDRGRFTAHERSTVVGATPVTKYDGAPNWACDPVPQEPSLDVNINEMPVCGEPHEQRPSPSPEPSIHSSALATPQPHVQETTSSSSSVVLPEPEVRLGSFSRRTFRRL